MIGGTGEGDLRDLILGRDHKGGSTEDGIKHQYVNVKYIFTSNISELFKMSYHLMYTYIWQAL